MDDELDRDYWELRDPFERAADEVDAARAEFPPIVVVGKDNRVLANSEEVRDRIKRAVYGCLVREIDKGTFKDPSPDAVAVPPDAPVFRRVLHNQAFETAAVRLERMVAGSDHEDVEPEDAVRRVLSDLLAQLEVTVEGGAS
jgi:hypothetical protein